MPDYPRYRSHKTVEALKIKEVQVPTLATPGEGTASHPSRGSFHGTAARILVFEDEQFEPMRVSLEYVRKHNPKAGGYWVRYSDGYESWSPAEAFEEGYTLLSSEYEP